MANQNNSEWFYGYAPKPSKKNGELFYDYAPKPSKKKVIEEILQGLYPPKY